MKQVLFLCLILITCVQLGAEEKSFDSGRNPTTAMLLSALPGGGQIYNKQYIKASIDIIAESLLIGTAIRYHIKMNNAYSQYEHTHNQAFYDEYNFYYQHRQNMIWWWATVKLLAVIDAYVDAKMFNFNEKKQKIDLEFEGLGLSLKYHF